MTNKSKFLKNNSNNTGADAESNAIKNTSYGAGANPNLAKNTSYGAGAVPNPSVEKFIIRMTLRSYDHKCIQKVIDDCTKIIKLSGGIESKPLALPKTNSLTSLLRSPHVYKGSLDQFSLKINKVIFDIKCGTNTLNALKELNIHGGVEVSIEILLQRGNQ